MWRLFSEQALSEGDDVIVNIASSMSKSTELEYLKSLGGLVTGRPNLTVITRKLAQRNLYSRFSNFLNQDEDIVVLSMGGIGDCLWIPDLLASYWKSKVPWVIIVQSNGEHIVSNESQRDILRRFYARSKSVIFVSQQNKQLAERQLAYRFSNAHIVINPIRDSMSEPLVWPKSENAVWNLAEVARFEVYQKRQDHLLEALSTPEWANRDWKLNLYGSGPDHNHIHSLVKHYGLEGKVNIVGYIKSFKDIWLNNHIHILPTAYEGVPLSLIESMFCGRPAVITRAGGNAELVRDGIEGYVSPGMHPEIIRETLERAWADRERWSQMGLSAFDRVSGLVPENWASRMLEILKGSVDATSAQ